MEDSQSSTTTILPQSPQPADSIMSTNVNPKKITPISSSSSRYENQKRRDWNTFGQYLRDNRPTLTLSRCTSIHVLEFLRYLDQFGKTVVHTPICPFFGRSVTPTPCTCPLRQAWGSLDAIVGRLRAAYEENGGDSDVNPFAGRAVRRYLLQVRDLQAKSRGMSYEKRKRKQPPMVQVEETISETPPPSGALQLQLSKMPLILPRPPMLPISQKTSIPRPMLLEYSQTPSMPPPRPLLLEFSKVPSILPPPPPPLLLQFSQTTETPTATAKLKVKPKPEPTATLTPKPTATPTLAVSLIEEKPSPEPTAAPTLTVSLIEEKPSPTAAPTPSLIEEKPVPTSTPTMMVSLIEEKPLPAPTPTAAPTPSLIEEKP